MGQTRLTACPDRLRKKTHPIIRYIEQVPSSVRQFLQRRPWHFAFALALAVGVSLVLAGSAFWTANQALNEFSTAVVNEFQLAFTDAKLNRPLPVGVEALNTPSAYRDAISNQGHLYLCGPTGLFSFNADGSPAAS